MTNDGRKLDRATQAHIRRQVVLAVRKGMTQVEAAKVFGMSLRFVHKSGGLRSLKGDHRGRPAGAGRLDGQQQARIYRMITGKMPDQLRLPFYLWTRQGVCALIKREYGVEVSLTTVGRYLKSWGRSVQKPVRRAYERNDEAIAQWCRETYPALARQARRDGVQIYWGDEMGLRSDHVVGTSFAPIGQTPVVRAAGRRFGCNKISAITNRGAMAFMVFAQKFTNAVFIEFLKRLIKHSALKVVLIVDGHPVHRSKAVRDFVAGHAQQLKLVMLPGYCPELNPDELINQDVKTNALGKSRPTNKAKLVSTVRAHLHRRQKQPQVVRNLFRQKHVRYAA